MNRRTDTFQLETFNRLQKQMTKFIRGGLKESDFSPDLYKMLAHEADVFGPEFDLKSFYQVRFRQEAVLTAESLDRVEKEALKPLCKLLQTAIRKQMKPDPKFPNRMTVED